jgi:hypothetical protein
VSFDRDIDGDGAPERALVKMRAIGALIADPERKALAVAACDRLEPLLRSAAAEAVDRHIALFYGMFGNINAPSIHAASIRLVSSRGCGICGEATKLFEFRGGGYDASSLHFCKSCGSNVERLGRGCSDITDGELFAKLFEPSGEQAYTLSLGGNAGPALGALTVSFNMTVNQIQDPSAVIEMWAGAAEWRRKYDSIMDRLAGLPVHCRIASSLGGNVLLVVIRGRISGRSFVHRHAPWPPSLTLSFRPPASSADR